MQKKTNIDHKLDIEKVMHSSNIWQFLENALKFKTSDIMKYTSSLLSNSE